jgi:hypothetical protein
MRLAALSVCRRLVPAAPSLRPRPPPPFCALRQLASRQDGRREERNPRRGRFVAAGLLTWLGLAKREGDDEPESELVLTIKRGILAARVSAALFLSHPLPLTAHYWWWIRLQLCLSDQEMLNVECYLQEGDLKRADQMFHIALRMTADLGKFQLFKKSKNQYSGSVLAVVFGQNVKISRIRNTGILSFHRPFLTSPVGPMAC